MSKEIAVALCVECAITEDDEQFTEGSGLAVFGANSLGEQMGYKPGSFSSDDCLGAAQMMAERVAESLEWAEPPSVIARMERGGALVKAVVNPGCVGEEDWEAFTASFAKMCVFYGAKTVHLAQGVSLDGLLRERLAPSAGAPERASRALKASKA